MTALVPCMGGWCRRRNDCLHYRLGSPAREPVERLCPKGEDTPEVVRVWVPQPTPVREAVR